MRRFKIPALILFICLGISTSAQVNSTLYDHLTSTLKDSDLVYFDKGKTKFQQESYLEAIPFFERVLQNNSQVPELNYITGICYSYNVNETHKALEYIYKAGNEASKIDGYYFNLAYALEKNDSISNAIEKYKMALSAEEKKGNKPLINEINYRLGRCKKINEYKTKQNLVRISNISKPVNTDASEYCPLISSNESIMIFTYRGPKSKGGKQKLKAMKSGGDVGNVEIFYEDIFMSRKINDSTWSEPESVDNLNTILHDAAVALSADGTKLFIYRNNGAGKGDLYLSTLTNSVFSKPVYQAGLNSHEWDGSACFVPYQDKVIFASERKGGLGGKDLYIAEKIKPNTWGNIKNLGPTINTKYDEDAPFITTDGKILFFSSNNHNSIGAYDVFRSDLKNNDWQTPYNLGPPINTKNDDKFFIVRGDGKVGYYSTYKQGGKGDHDIYRIEPGVPGMPIELLEVNGFVNIDGKPAAATIEINSVLKHNQFSTKATSNKSTGNFVTNLPAGDKYEVIVKADKFPQQVIELSTVGIDSFIVLNVFVDFNSADYDKKLEELEKKAGTDEKSSFDKAAFEGKYGALKKEGLTYKVQIGAYKFFENFNYNNILGFPKIIRQTDNDYITRFVMGNYETYNDALELLTKIKDSGALKDSFILGYYKGEKKYLYQLLSEKIVE